MWRFGLVLALYSACRITPTRRKAVFCQCGVRPAVRIDNQRGEVLHVPTSYSVPSRISSSGFQQMPPGCWPARTRSTLFLACFCRQPAVSAWQLTFQVQDDAALGP